MLRSESDDDAAVSRKKIKKKRRVKARPPGQMHRPARVRFGVLTAVWQRHALTDQVLRRYSVIKEQVRDVVELVPLAVGSEGALSREIVEGAGWLYVEHPNKPLGAKWNAGLAALQKVGVDAVLIVGSDDIVNKEIFTLYADQHAAGKKFQALRDMYFLDLRTMRMCFWGGYSGIRAGDPIGMGRLIHSDYLDAVGWHLWDDALNAGLDKSMNDHLDPLVERRGAPQELAIYGSRDIGVAAVDVKTGENIWSYDSVAEALTVEPVEAEPFLREHFPDDEVEALLVMHHRFTPTIDPGLRLFAEGDYAGARPLLEQRVASAPTDTEALHGLGLTQLDMGAHETALASFERLAELSPYDGDAFNVLGVLQFEVGQVHASIRSLIRAAHLQPTTVSHLSNLIRVMYAVRRYEDALLQVAEVGALAAQIPMPGAGPVTAELKQQIERLMDEAMAAPRSADAAAALVNACWPLFRESAAKLLEPSVRSLSA